MKLDDLITTIPGIGPRYKNLLEVIGIKTIENLLLHIPFRYSDESKVVKINELSSDESCTVLVEISKIDNIFTRFGKKITKAKAIDNTGEIELLWFNQHYMKKALPIGTKVALYGKLKEGEKKKIMIAPQFEVIYDGKKELIHTAKIVPIYNVTNGLTPKWLRAKLNYILENINIPEFLTNDLIVKYNLISKTNAIKQIHFPDSFESAAIARKQLSFEELLKIHLKGIHLRNEWQLKKLGVSINVNSNIIDKFIANLPFKLTVDQTESVKHVIKDLQHIYPMNRLLLGDVGSGKTIVALIACLAVINDNRNCIYIAPTQVLAKQHFDTFNKFLNNIDVDVHLILGNTKEIRVDNNKNYIVIGTHAVLHHLDAFNNIGFIIIDEQHKFGVLQRSEIIDYYSTNRVPNLLTMTATPIPRSIALTLYGDLDVSSIVEMPRNRKIVKTWVIKEDKRDDCYKWMKKEMTDNNLQTIIVCPFIEESAVKDLQHVKSVLKEYETIQNEFKSYKVGLLHGKMKDKEKDNVILEFREHNIDILVTTPVIEVGIDIPNANIIFIETAERFGLASLHQLRGRVGRGEKQGYCILVPSTSTYDSVSRLKNLETIYNGQKLAELDLKIRGPGDIYGTEQSGAINLQVADFTDYLLIKQTKEEALKIINGESESNLEIKNYLLNIDKISKN